jgi:CRP-like cAMP-binding protein
MNRQILKLVMPDHIGQSEIYDAGMTLLHQGCFDPVLFILEWGAVEVIKDGIQLTVLNHPGSIFGDLSSLLEIPHTASVRVVERSSFRVIRQANVAFRSSPKLTLFIAQQLARRFISLDNQPPEMRTLI